MSRVFVVDSICLKKQEIKRTMFIIFCQHMPTQKRDYMYRDFVSIWLHKQEITRPVFVCQQMHTQKRDYMYRDFVSVWLHKQEITPSKY